MPLFQNTAQSVQQASDFFVNPNVDVFGGGSRPQISSVNAGIKPVGTTAGLAQGVSAMKAGAGLASGGMGQALASKAGSAASVGGAGGQMGAGGVMQIAEGVGQLATSLIGGRARRREQREARAELAQRKAEYEQFEFKDPTADMTNPFEDMTVNQQQAQFESQQQQQALAGTLSGLSAAAGGSGIGALAQSLAQQQATNLQRSAASIGMQESQQQFAKAQGAQQLQAARAEGAKYVQEREFGRTEDLYSTAAARKAAADEARKQATEGLVGGVANIASGVARTAFAGGM